ncbi:glycosyltransferase [Egibacter rhizosphaerae]|uniref:glycosyltransferase n=1 Tax=Egibacter rhizosphaerae TaxID=1670831 RepID=UPI00197A895B|nr:glycosyltransferase [Egibacter rhizosphaerae]
MRVEDVAGPAAWPHQPTPDLSGTRVGLLSVHTSPLAQPGTGDSGGLNVAVCALGRQLVRCGATVEVFTRATDDASAGTVEIGDGARVHHVPAGPPELAKHELANHLCAFYLSMAVDPIAHELDLVHAHYWMSGWVARKLRQRHGVPFVQSFHTLARAKNAALAPGDAPEPALRTTAEERIAQEADAVLASTEDEASLLRTCYGASAGRVRVAPLGVDTEVFAPDAADRERTRVELGVDGPLLLFVGRLQPLKGPDVAIEALAALREREPAAQLVVVGGASGTGVGTTDPQGLASLARQCGVEDAVRFLEPRPQRALASLYRAADVVLMPSRSESFGLVALEAQACGTAVVAADVGGLRAALGEGAGRLVRGHRPEDYAAAVSSLVSEPDRLAAAGLAGARHAQRLGWDRAAAAAAGVYAEVLDEARAEPVEAVADAHAGAC